MKHMPCRKYGGVSFLLIPPYTLSTPTEIRMETRICSKCGLEKDIEQFPLRNRFTQRRQSYCVDCKSVMHKNWYEKNKEYQIANARKHTTQYRNTLNEYVWNYLLKHPCERCGESDPVVLEFNHLHSKDMAISKLVASTTNIKRLEKELKKTQVLCSNCHRRITVKERGWFRGSK